MTIVEEHLLNPLIKEKKILMSTIEVNLNLIKQEIMKLERKYAREYGSVQLIAASKGQSIEKMTEAYRAGQFRFGENYLQEALVKISAFSLIAPVESIEWHFIGTIQSNKTHKIAEHFSWVHSIASEKIAQRLNDQRPSHLPKLNICIEVNVSNEPSKSGVPITEAASLIKFCESLPNLHVRGLMSIPEETNNFSEQRNEFKKLHDLFNDLRQQGFLLDTLSMGMSHDFEAAIAEGSTLVRIGTSIFGQRV